MNYNPNDYVVLNPIGELSHISKNQIAVGIKNFSLMGQDVIMEYYHDGKIYKRLHTDIIPRELMGKICSVQIFEEVKK